MLSIVTLLGAKESAAQSTPTGQLTIVTPDVLSACNTDTIELQLINLDGPVCPSPGAGGGLATVTVNIPADSLMDYVAGSLSSNVPGGANFVSYVNKVLTITMPVPVYGSTTIAKFVVRPECQIVDEGILPQFSGTITYPAGYPTAPETYTSASLNTGTAILDNPESKANVNNIAAFSVNFASSTRPINVGYGNLNTVEYGVIVDTAMPAFYSLYLYSKDGFSAAGTPITTWNYNGAINPATVTKTMYDATHWLYKFNLTGSLLGPDLTWTPAEELQIVTAYTPPGNCTTLTGKYYVSYSCPGSGTPCTTPDTLNGTVRVTAGVPVLSGINYQIDSFDGCPDKAGFFYFKNTATGVHPIGTAYDVNLNLNFGNVLTVSNVTIGGVAPATIPLSTTNNGSSVAFNIKDLLTTNFDGIGVGLEDLDADGYFDDLKAGDSIRVNFTYTVPCDLKCGSNLNYIISSGATFTDYCRVLNGSTGTEMYRFGFSQKQAVTQKNIPNYGNLWQGGTNNQTRGAGFTFQFQDTNMNLATTVATLRISYNNFSELDTSNIYLFGVKIPGSALTYDGINIPGDSTNSFDSAVIYTLTPAQVALLFDGTPDSLYYAQTIYNCERRQTTASTDYWQMFVRTKPGLCSNGSQPCNFDLSCKKAYLYNANYGCGNKPCFVVNDTLWREQLIGHTSVAQTAPLLGDPRRMYENDTLVYNHSFYISNDWPIESPIGTWDGFAAMRQNFSLNFAKPAGYIGLNPLIFLEDISRAQVYARDSVTGAKGALLFDVPLKLSHFITPTSLAGGVNTADMQAMFYFNNTCSTCNPFNGYCSYVNWVVDPGNCPVNDTSIYRGSPYYYMFNNVDNDKATQLYYLSVEKAFEDAGLQFKIYDNNKLFEVNTRWRVSDQFPWGNITDFSFRSYTSRDAEGNYTITGEGIGSCGTAQTAGLVAPKDLTIANPNSAYSTQCGLTLRHELNFDSYAGNYFGGGEVRVPYKVDSFVVDLPNQFSLAPGSYQYTYNQSCTFSTTNAVTASALTGHIRFTHTPGGDFPRIDDCAGFTIASALQYNVVKTGVASPSTYKFPVKVYARTEWGQPLILNDSASITEAVPILDVVAARPVAIVEDGGKCAAIALDVFVTNNSIYSAPFVYLAAENSLGGTTIITINDGDSVYADPILPSEVTTYGAKHRIAKVGTIDPGQTRTVRVLVSSTACLDSFKVYVDFGCAYPSPMAPIKTSGTIDSLWIKYKSVRPAISSTPVGDINAKTLCGTDTVEIEVRNVRAVNVYDMIATFTLPSNVRYVPGTAYAKGDTRVAGLPPSWQLIPEADDSLFNGGDSVVLSLKNVAPFNTTCGLGGTDTLSNATVRIRFEVSYNACPVNNIDPILYTVTAENYCGTVATSKGALNVRYVGSTGTPNTYSCSELQSKPVLICAKVNQPQEISDTLYIQNLGGYGGLSGVSSGLDSMLITIPTDSTLFALNDFEVLPGYGWGNPGVGTDPQGRVVLGLVVPAGIAVNDSLPLPVRYRVTPKVKGLCTVPSATCPNLSFFTSFTSTVLLGCPDSGIACLGLRKEVRGRSLQLRDFVCCGALGNYVWLDSNKNGVQDATEVGVAGITVDLYQNGADSVAGTADDILIGSTQTDASGLYYFDELIPTYDKTKQYNVGVTMPTGYVITTPISRGDNGINTNSDGDTLAGFTYARSTSINLSPNERDSTFDFGIYYPKAPTATVGNYVWFDTNKNGLQDPTEQGISGVTVTLKDGTGKTVAVTTTDGDGYYQFTDVPPGNGYRVTVSPIVGYIPTTNSGAITSPNNSDIAVSTLTTATFNVLPGDNISYVDAGFVPQAANRASLGDRVWYDANNNGVQDPGEDGVAGVTVKLLNGPGTSTLQTALTDANGNYVFNNLAAGSYRVEFDLAAFPSYTITPKNATTNTYSDGNADPATGRTDVIFLGAGENNMTIDAGIYNPNNTNSIGNFVWEDINQNGIQDPTEQGVSGVTVTLYNSTGTPIAVTGTDVNGAYSFPGLPNGTYSVGFSNLDPGYLFTTKETAPSATGSDADILTGRSGPIVLSGNTNNNDIDAGIVKAGDRFTASVGNYVWYDLNNNGIQDPNESGVSGVNVTLIDAGKDGIAGNADDGPSVLTQTNGQGEYMFTGLKASNYQVAFSDLPAGYSVSPANSGTDDTKDSDPAALVSGVAKTPVFALADGTENLTLDLGIYKPGVNTIGNYVWLDANSDGQQGPTSTEPPVPGVEVTLMDSTGVAYDMNPSVPGIQPYVVSTDASGRYLFTNLPDGYYKVEFGNLPDGLKFTTPGTGSATDSDADTTNGITPVITAIGGVTNLDVDAGLVTDGKAALGNYVWNDVNNDGIQDPTEVGVAGILVTLYDGANQPVATTVTNANGGYLFTNLDPGTYSVGFTNIPSEMFFTKKDATADAADSDADPITGLSPAVTLAANEVNLTLDAGIYKKPTGSLGNFVWYDIDRDGKQDATEPGIGGVVVELLDATTGAWLASAVTDGSGMYSFTNLDTGTNKYVVKFAKLPSGYKLTNPLGTLTDGDNSDANPTTGATAPISVLPGQFNDKIDAGLVINDTLGNYVWVDANANGIQEVGEAGLAGVPVTLIDNVTGKVKAATVTDAYGFYEFTGIGKGQYFVMFSVPTGYTYTSNLDPFGTFVLQTTNNSDVSNQQGYTKPFLFETGMVNRNVDAGVVPIPDNKANVGDYVWLDADNDGLQDPSEEGIAGVVVTLVDDNGNVVASTLTDDAGKYLFTNVDPGTYQVKFTSPVGYIPTAQTGGLNDSTNSDIDPATNTSQLFTVVAGTDNLNIDAGFRAQSPTLASLGDKVWYDTDQDGVQDPTELGVPNVEVNLLDALNGLVSTTTTDALGNYVFNQLTPGNYKVQFVVPSGYALSPQAGTTDSASDSNPLPTGTTALISLAAGATNMTVDAGIYSTTLNTIGDYVWKDEDKDGIQDATENGVPGISVELLDPTGAVVATTLTDANGKYLFTGVPNGTYNVKFTNLPEDLKVTNQTTGTANGSDPNASGVTPAITVTGGQNITDLDAGLVTAPNLPSVASLGDKVWWDLDLDGLQDPTEPGVPGVKMYLYNASGTTLLDSTYTDAMGNYLFLNLQPNTYVVGLGMSTLPAGTTITTQNADGAGVGGALNSDANTSTGRTVAIPVGEGAEVRIADMGIRPAAGTSTVGDFVWFDLDKDGIQDANEPGATGVTVTLYNDQGVPVAATTTDADGKYLFANVAPGQYTATFTNLPAGYTLTSPTPGTASGSDPDSATSRTPLFTVPANSNVTDVDAGIITNTRAALGNYVWHDADADGVQDPTELPVAGVKVKLYNSAGAEISQTTTNEDGFYLFSNLLPGAYQVGFSNPFEPLTFTTKEAALSVEDGSNVNPATGRTDFLPLVAGEYNGTVDAGIIANASGSVGDLVWYDANGNGAQDAGEQGVPGVLVTLKDSTGATVGVAITDGDGNYLFNDVAPSTGYTIEFSDLPTGYGFTDKFGPVTGLTNSDATTTGATAPFAVAPGEAVRYVDAGLVIRDTLGNFVWNDLDKDGIQDATEPGVAGVTVTLYDATGAIVGTVLTDAYGKYEFADIPGGTYRVGFTLPSNYVFTQNTDALGTNQLTTVTNSDVDSATGLTKPFVFEAGMVNRNVDAGIFFKEPVSASVGNFVWEDLNANGIQDAGEPGIAGIVVTLYNNVGTPVAVTTTDGNGNYNFKDVAPGTYSVGFTSPVDFVPTTSAGLVNDPTNSDLSATTGQTAPFTLVAGQNNNNIDAGFVQQGSLLASLGNKVWFDTDQDGIQDANEDGVSGVTVELYNGAGTSLLATTKTNALGEYIFNGLAGGNYSVKFIAPSGFTITAQTAGADSTVDSNPNVSTGFTSSINLPAGSRNMTVDAGIFNPAANNSIGDFVWADTNSNGVQDPTEAGVSGVTVTLYNTTGGIVATTVTDKDGKYLFTGLPNGTYQVGFSNLPEGLVLTNQTTGTGTGSDPDPATGKTANVVLSGGTHLTDVDAGLKPTTIPSGTASLGNRVWWDLNNNGLQDPTEAGVPNMRVFLYDATGNTKLDSTMTDALGIYMFTGLQAGTYVVGFDYTTKPAGTGISGQNTDGQGIGGAANSDGNAVTGKTGAINLSTGEEKLTIDQGIVPAAGTGTVGDKVWLDANKDGVQDPTEPGVPGVQVVLLNSAGNPVATTTTDANGIYQFANVPPGTYTVEFGNLPAGMTFTTQTTGNATGSDADTVTGKTPTFSVAAGQNVTDVDAGLKTLRAALGNYVWLDANSNGLQDPTEQGIPGVTVTLLDKVGNQLASTVTDANGKYMFSNLLPGQYLVKFSNIGEGNVFTTKETTPGANGSDANPLSGISNLITLTAGQVNLDIDAGVRSGILGSLGDYVWLDDDKDGLQDANERGVPGVVAKLLDATGTVLAEAITDGDGYYHFADLPAGGYAVAFSNFPTGYKLTNKTGLLNDPLNSDVDTATKQTALYTLGNGEHQPRLDGGLIKTTINLYGHVWHDYNALTDNLVNNTGMTLLTPAVGIPTGIRLYLVDATTNSILRQTVANAGDSGKYQFLNIEAGRQYRVLVSSQAFAIGSQAPSTSTLLPLPTGWSNTGERIGLAPGSDGVVNGRLNVQSAITNADVFNVNFGIKPQSGEAIIP
jgi:protocatechuate 3,4-dioxygenase beta subunit